MQIELTTDQLQVIDTSSGIIDCIDPRTQSTYRLVREDVYRKLQLLAYDDSPWSSDEQALLAGEAFGKLDDIDYSHYLQDQS